MFGGLTSFESLFDEMRRMEREVDTLFGNGSAPAGIRSAARGAFPPANVGATADAVEVYLFAPGLDPKGIDVTVQQNLLLVSGQRQLAVREAVDYFRQERFSGPFRRVVTLPDDVDPNRVEATYRDGILQVTLQRQEAVRPRHIPVR